MQWVNGLQYWTCWTKPEWRRTQPGSLLGIFINCTDLLWATVLDQGLGVPAMLIVSSWRWSGFCRRDLLWGTLKGLEVQEYLNPWRIRTTILQHASGKSALKNPVCSPKWHVQEKCRQGLSLPQCLAYSGCSGCLNIYRKKLMCVPPDDVSEVLLQEELIFMRTFCCFAGFGTVCILYDFTTWNNGMKRKRTIICLCKKKRILFL